MVVYWYTGALTEGVRVDVVDVVALASVCLIATQSSNCNDDVTVAVAGSALVCCGFYSWEHIVVVSKVGMRWLIG